MVDDKGKKMENKTEAHEFEHQKLDLIRLRIRNKFYEREEILQKVVHEIYEFDIRNK